MPTFVYIRHTRTNTDDTSFAHTFLTAASAKEAYVLGDTLMPKVNPLHTVDDYVVEIPGVELSKQPQTKTAFESIRAAIKHCTPPPQPVLA